MKRALLPSILLAPLLVQCSAKSNASRPPPVCDPDRGATVARDRFTRYTLDGAASGPGFVAVADVDGDGRKDVVVSSLGPVAVAADGSSVTLSHGHVAAYLQGGTLGCWHKVDIVGDAAAMYFTNRPTAADVDGDGDVDIVQPAGFFVCQFDSHVGDCGAIAWFENDGTGTSWKRHDVVPFGDSRFYHHVVLVDFDGDGIDDLVTVGETSSGANAMWFKGDRSPDRFAKAPLAIGEGLGSFPFVADMDGDGDLDVASAEYFEKDSSFAWFERTAAPSEAAPAGAWTRHAVNTDSGRGFMLSLVPNLYGDGVTRAVGTNHTNANDTASAPVESSVFVFDVSKDPRGSWPKTRISSGIVSRPSHGTAVQGAPGVFGYGDIDGDGDVDLAVAGDGDIRTFWMEQTAPGAFTMHTLEDSLGQAAGAQVVDLDGDGKNELVFTGYEDNAVYVYARGN